MTFFGKILNFFVFLYYLHLHLQCFAFITLVVNDYVHRAPIWTRKKATTESNTGHDPWHRWHLGIFSKENLPWPFWLCRCSKTWDPRRDF